MPRTPRAPPVPILLILRLLLLLAPPAASAPSTEANYTVLNGLANVTSASLSAWLAQFVPQLAVASVTVTNLSATTVTPQTCGLGTFSPADSQSCSVCPPGTYSPTLAAVSSAACVPCPTGTYSAQAGATALADCTSCPADTYFEGTGGSDLSNCTACAANSGSSQPYLKANCVCNAGYYGPGGEHPRGQFAPPRSPKFFLGHAGFAPSCSQSFF
jgi:hypothetical protein